MNLELNISSHSSLTKDLEKNITEITKTSRWDKTDLEFEVGFLKVATESMTFSRPVSLFTSSARALFKAEWVIDSSQSWNMEKSLELRYPLTFFTMPDTRLRDALYQLGDDCSNMIWPQRKKTIVLFLQGS